MKIAKVFISTSSTGIHLRSLLEQLFVKSLIFSSYCTYDKILESPLSCCWGAGVGENKDNKNISRERILQMGSHQKHLSPVIQPGTLHYRLILFETSSSYKNNTYRPILKQYKYIFNHGLKVLV